jgi:TRAP transporter TAXI family solute receptor
MTAGLSPTSKRFRARLTAVLLVVIIVVGSILYARPPTDLTIETGPVGGSYYLDAQHYQAILAAHGIHLRLKPTPNSLEIAHDVANPRSGIDVGFIAQAIDPSKDATLFSLGQTELQPLFIFASAKLGRQTTLDDLRGRRIVMPPSDSATSDAAIRIFQLYDITQDNTSFSYMPLAEAAKQLQAGKFDAGVFMLAAENPVIRALANNSGMTLVPLLETKAIANHLPFLRAVLLPRGIYNIADGVPPSTTPMVAAPVSVVVHAGLHPYLVFSLLQAMSEVHRGPTFLTEAGDFPTSVGSVLTVHPLAAQYYASGLPWIYRELPPWLASAVDEDQLVGVGGFLLIALYLVAMWLADAGVAITTVIDRWRHPPAKQHVAGDGARTAATVPANE